MTDKKTTYIYQIGRGVLGRDEGREIGRCFFLGRGGPEKQEEKKGENLKDKHSKKKGE